MVEFRRKVKQNSAANPNALDVLLTVTRALAEGKKPSSEDLAVLSNLETESQGRLQVSREEVTKK